MAHCPRGDCQLDPFASMTEASEARVVTAEHDFLFDTTRGGIASWVPKIIGRELVDGERGVPFGAPINERICSGARTAIFEMDWLTPGLESPDGWNPHFEATRSPPTQLLQHRVRHHALGVHVVQRLTWAGGADATVTVVTYVPNWAPWVELEVRWREPDDRSPHSTYVPFPFALPNATERVDVADQEARPGLDQLPNAYAGFFTANNWVDLSTPEGGVTVALAENPIVMFGGYRFGQRLAHQPSRGLLFGWPANNFWETNYSASQPGEIVARYRILPYAGAFDALRAHRFGLDTAHRLPLVDHHGEAPLPGPAWPGTGSVLRFSDGAVRALHLRPMGDGVALLRLLNVSDTAAEATVGSAALKIKAVTVIGQGSDLARAIVTSDGFRITLAPRQMVELSLVLAA